MSATYNAYNFPNIDALRKFIAQYRQFEELASEGEINSATMLIDIRRGLGYDPGSMYRVVTKRQADAIRLHLIEGVQIDEAATMLRVNRRTAFYLVQAGLQTLLVFLNFGTIRARRWSPWQLAILRDPSYSTSEIAARTGRTHDAVDSALRRTRHRSEHARTLAASRRPASQEWGPQEARNLDR